MYLSDNISYGYLNNEPFYVDFGTDNDLDIKKEYEYFKVACLDKNGNVLKVSNMASAKSYGNILDFNYFSLSEKGIKPIYQLNPYNTVGIIVLIAIPITIIIIVIQRKKEQKNKG